MHTLIAGWGDLGSRLGALLRERGQRVTGLRRRVAPEESVQVLACDLADLAPNSLAELGVDRLVISVAPDRRTPEDYRRVYRDGSLRAIEALGSSLRRVVFVSSTSVYGDVEGGWVDEQTPAEPDRWQGEELLHAEAWIRHRFPDLVVARASGLYGPGRLRMLELARSGMPGARRWTNRIHIEDAAAALAHLLELELPAPLYLLSDCMPAPEDDVLAWLRARLAGSTPDAEAPSAAEETEVAGRRISARLLQDSGFAFRYPDYRSGYAGLIQ